MNRIPILIGLLSLVMVGFQNCQPARISGASEAYGKAELTPVVSADAEDTTDTVGDMGDQVPGSVVQDGATTGPGNGHGNQPRPGDSTSSTGDDGSGHYVCILEGPGKSIKLGQMDGLLGGQHKVPGVLCMSRHACLDIASQAFAVQGPYFRGYCKVPHGNPHVTQVSDDELQARVNEFLNK